MPKIDEISLSGNCGAGERFYIESAGRKELGKLRGSYFGAKNEEGLFFFLKGVKVVFSKEKLVLEDRWEKEMLVAPQRGAVRQQGRDSEAVEKSHWLSG